MIQHLVLGQPHLAASLDWFLDNNVTKQTTVAWWQFSTTIINP